jgi:hypothetical protein
VFIPENYFVSKSFAAVCESFWNAYPDQEVSNMVIIHRLVTTFWDIGSVCDKCSSRYKIAEVTAVPISSSASAATMGYSCKNLILPLVLSFSA